MTDDLTAPDADSSEFFRELDTQLLVHELKSPLSLIEATTRTLLEHTPRLGPGTERQERALKRILRGAVRGRRTVDQLLEVGRAESSQFSMASFDLVEAVLSAVLEAIESIDGEFADRLYAENDRNRKLSILGERGIQLRIAPGLDNLRIFQDPFKLDLIVGNLVQNALHFRHELVEIALQEEGDDVIISVKDDGPGISPEYHTTVFESYKQVPANDGLERKGHGLGLAGALILARRLGGDISLESVPGRGATFRVRIPRQLHAQAQPN